MFKILSKNPWPCQDKRIARLLNFFLFLFLGAALSRGSSRQQTTLRSSGQIANRLLLVGEGLFVGGLALLEWRWRNLLLEAAPASS
jgi:hypothetical protein